MTGLGNRVHIFANPETRDQVTSFFTTILGCEEAGDTDPVHLPPEIQLFRFPDGSAISVEYAEVALTMRDARRGAYLEVRTDDPVALRQQVTDAGLSQVHYPGTGFFYFQAPGGQVWRIAPDPAPS